MFAILVTEENKAQILETSDLADSLRSAVDVALSLQTEWYFIRGYHSEAVRYPFNTLLPAYKLKTGYEYDPIKIKTQWDQIVRK